MNKSNKNSGFNTPKGYFEDFTDKLMDKLSNEGSVLPSDDGFTAPKGYFENLNQKITVQVSQRAARVVQLHPYRKYYFVAAAAAAVVLFFFGLNWNRSNEMTFTELAHSDIEIYFDNYDLGLSSYEIAEVLPVDELDISDMMENQLNEDNVIDYLNDNIDDFEELNLDNDE